MIEWTDTGTTLLLICLIGAVGTTRLGEWMKMILAHLVGLHRAEAANVTILNGGEWETKKFDGFYTAVNYLAREGFSIKTEASDENSYSIWFEKKEVVGGMIDNGRQL